MRLLPQSRQAPSQWTAKTGNDRQLPVLTKNPHRPKGTHMLHCCGAWQKSVGEKAEALFHAVLEHAPEARPAFLERACHEDSALRRQVELLVSQAAQADSFLESPLFENETKATRSE
jgi:hypothetical protein